MQKLSIPARENQPTLMIAASNLALGSESRMELAEILATIEQYKLYFLVCPVVPQKKGRLIT